MLPSRSASGGTGQALLLHPHPSLLLQHRNADQSLPQWELCPPHEALAKQWYPGRAQPCLQTSASSHTNTLLPPPSTRGPTPTRPGRARRLRCAPRDGGARAGPRCGAAPRRPKRALGAAGKERRQRSPRGAARRCRRLRGGRGRARRCGSAPRALLWRRQRRLLFPARPRRRSPFPARWAAPHADVTFHGVYCSRHFEALSAGGGGTAAERRATGSRGGPRAGSSEPGVGQRLCRGAGGAGGQRRGPAAPPRLRSAGDTSPGEGGSAGRSRRALTPDLPSPPPLPFPSSRSPPLRPPGQPPPPAGPSSPPPSPDRVPPPRLGE